MTETWPDIPFETWKDTPVRRCISGCRSLASIAFAARRGLITDGTRHSM